MKTHSTVGPVARVFSQVAGTLLLLVAPLGFATEPAALPKPIVQGDTRSAESIADTPAPTASLDEVQLRNSLIARGKSLLLAGDLAGFEHLADDYRATQERTPAGAWKLWALYKSINVVGSKGPSDPEWARLEGRAEDWLKRSPTSPTAVIVAAKTYYEHAWAYRGHGYASEVGSGGEAAYENFLERTRVVLDGHPTVAAADPEWDVLRISIAREQGAASSEIVERANAALTRQPYFYAIHYSAANALLPKWGGSEELVQEYVQTAVQHSAPKEGTQAYALIYFDIASKDPNPLDALNLTGAKWPQFKQSLGELVRAHPDPFNLEMAREMACFAGDKGAYLGFGKRTAGIQSPIAWWDDQTRRQSCDDWAYGKSTYKASLSDRARTYVNFLRGEGAVYWRNVILTGLLLLAIASGVALRTAPRSGAPHEQWLAATSNEADRFNPYDYPREYRVSPRARLLRHALVLQVVVIALASIWSLADIPWAEPVETTIVVVLLALAAILGVIFVWRSLASRVVLSADRIDLYGVISHSHLMRDDILGKAGPLSRHGAELFFLVPKPQRGRLLSVPPVSALDAAFGRWFTTLPDATIDPVDFEPADQRGPH